MTNGGFNGFASPAGASDVPIIPPATSAVANTAEGTWYSANRTTLMRFFVEVRTRLAGAVLDCGAASGNIELAIYSVKRAGLNSFNMAKLVSSGVIACPTPGTSPMGASSIWVPLTAAFTLDPGQYAVGLWCDNTTATFAHGLSNPVARTGWSISDIASNAGGAPPTLAAAPYAGRAFACTLETSAS